MVEDEKKEGLKRLFWAVETGKIKVMDELLNKGFSPNTFDKETGQTLLIKAVINKQVSVANKLIERGANPHKEDLQGKKAFDYLQKFDSNTFEEKDRDVFAYVSSMLMGSETRRAT